MALMAIVLTVFAALRPTVSTHAGIVTRRAALANRAAAERAGAEAIYQDRTGRLALLEKEALPLLRGISQGTLDPTDPAVQARFLTSMSEWLRKARAAGLETEDIEAIYRTALRNCFAEGVA